MMINEPAPTAAAPPRVRPDFYDIEDVIFNASPSAPLTTDQVTDLVACLWPTVDHAVIAYRVRCWATFI